MPLIAIIHIPDDHTADGLMSPDIEWPNGSRLVGVYNFPTKSELTCGGSCTRKGSGAWSRHKLGFMKCSICGSRNKNVRRWFAGALFDWFGANLYPDAPKLFQTPEGYGPPREQ